MKSLLTACSLLWANAASSEQLNRSLRGSAAPNEDAHGWPIDETSSRRVLQAVHDESAHGSKLELHDAAGEGGIRGCFIVTTRPGDTETATSAHQPAEALIASLTR